MKITSAEFVKSAFNMSHWTTDGLPEIAFLGRSNVGKSSLLNSLLQRKGLARTSNTPGRTQSINYFLINGSRGVGSGRHGTPKGVTPTGFYFVDLPGYGYAKVSKAMRADWGKMAEEYLSERDELVLSIQLIDSRHEPTEQDMDLNEWLIQNGKPFMIVATKADKLSNNQLQKQLKVIGNSIGGGKLIPFSAVSGKGRDEVWAEILNAIR